MAGFQREEAEPTGPFVTGSLAFPSHLLSEQSYSTSAGHFVAQLEALSSTYGTMRVVRGDGSCFYRSLLYRLCELLVSNEAERVRLLGYVKESLKTLTTLGYDEFTMEGFQEELVELLEIQIPKASTGEVDLHVLLNDPHGCSQACTWYCRPLCSAYMKSNPDQFMPFIEAHPDIDSFCKAEVEPSFRECEQLQIIALTSAFGIKVNVVYLDGHDAEKVTTHSFGEGALEMTMLYRPGHYDLLYKKE